MVKLLPLGRRRSSPPPARRAFTGERLWLEIPRRAHGRGTAKNLANLIANGY
jgi:hypothetical protein